MPSHILCGTVRLDHKSLKKIYKHSKYSFKGYLDCFFLNKCRALRIEFCEIGTDRWSFVLGSINPWDRAEIWTHVHSAPAFNVEEARWFGTRRTAARVKWLEDFHALSGVRIKYGGLRAETRVACTTPCVGEAGVLESTDEGCNRGAFSAQLPDGQRARLDALRVQLADVFVELRACIDEVGSAMRVQSYAAVLGSPGVTRRMSVGDILTNVRAGWRACAGLVPPAALYLSADSNCGVFSVQSCEELILGLQPGARHADVYARVFYRIVTCGVVTVDSRVFVATSADGDVVGFWDPETRRASRWVRAADTEVGWRGAAVD
jgi:hypothetical protein